MSILLTCGAPAPHAQTASHKAVWEPVNYPDDIRLRSVYFANDRVGWAAGSGNGDRGGVIVHTADGGESWTVQLGDPKSSEPSYQHLHFLDAQHGWAAQGKRLLRTTDGKSWQDAGSFPSNHELQRYVFTSPQNGIEVTTHNHARVFITKDSGRTWRETFKCEVTMNVQGLARKMGCAFIELAFPSPRVGYAVGGNYSGGFASIAKTEDGGETWRIIFASTEVETIDAAFFTDESRGVIRARDNKVYVTDDGGQSWRGLAASARGPIRFADPAVGWSCTQATCSYSTDGGRSWTSRDVRLPSHIHAFSVPRRDRIFIVGDHGMVYRYRVVPASEPRRPNVFDAPLLPAYAGQFNTQIAGLKAQVRELEAQLAKAPESGPMTPAVAQETSVPVKAASTGFTQDASFSQDVLAAPPSPAVRDCCAPLILNLQAQLDGLSKQVPAFAESHRNLNLLFVGLNMLSDMQGRAAGLRGAFLAVKQSQDLKTAAAALQDLVAKLEDTSAAVSSGFQLLAASSVQQTPAAVSNMAAPSAPAAQSTPAQTASPPKESTGPSIQDVTNTLQRLFRR